MTAPIPSLPGVQLGNTASDIGSGINTFVQGLVGQRLRQQQIAMQQAMQSSQQALQGAQTADVTQQAQERAHMNLPADDNDEALLRQYLPNAPRGILQGKTKAEADEIIKFAQTAHLMGMRLGMTGSSQIINRYNAQNKVHNDAYDAYMRVRGMLDSGSAMTPTMAAGALAQLAVPGNAREASTILSTMRSGGPLGGPFTAYENVFNQLGKVFNTQGNTLDPTAMAEVRRAADALIANHRHMHDIIKQTALNQASAEGIDMSPDELESEDRFQSLDQQPPTSTPVPGSQSPTGSWTPNPRFTPQTQPGGRP